MTSEDFKLALAALNLNQKMFSRILLHLGDPASPVTVLRRVERWAHGGMRIPGEAVAFMALLGRAPEALAAICAELEAEKAAAKAAKRQAAA